MAQWVSPNMIFCVRSCSRDVISSGRIPASSERSAALAARFADRTDANVAMASTRVPAAVPTDASVSQFATMILILPAGPARPWTRAPPFGAALPGRRFPVTSALAPRYSPLLS
jgi:hypothetical protein